MHLHTKHNLELSFLQILSNRDNEKYFSFLFFVLNKGFGKTVGFIETTSVDDCGSVQNTLSFHQKIAIKAKDGISLHTPVISLPPTHFSLHAALFARSLPVAIIPQCAQLN